MAIGSLARMFLLFSGIVGNSWPLQAQFFFSTPDPCFWEGGNLVLIRRNQPVGGEAGWLVSPSGKLLKNAVRPGPKAILDFVDGVFYAFERVSMSDPDEKGRRKSTVAISKCENGKWITLAKGVFPGMGPSMIWPLREGRYLALTIQNPVFEEDGKGFPLAILKVNDRSEFYISTRMDFGLEKTFFDKGTKQPYYGQLVMSFLSPPFVRAGNYLVIGTQFGLFFVFDGSNGRLKRTARIYPDLKDEHLTGKDDQSLLPGLLGWAGRDNGEVLISARNQDAVIYGYAGRNGENPVSDAARARLADQINARYPIVEWWNLEPESGRIDHEIPPVNFPDRVYSEKAAKDFNWRFLPNGNLELVSFNDRFKRPAEPTSPVGGQGKVAAPVKAPAFKKP